MIGMIKGYNLNLSGHRSFFNRHFTIFARVGTDFGFKTTDKNTCLVEFEPSMECNEPGFSFNAGAGIQFNYDIFSLRGEMGTGNFAFGTSLIVR